MLQTLTPEQTDTIQKITLSASHLSDKEIIQHIKDGDVDAYSSIMRRYNQRMYRIARSFITNDAAAMDIVQEAHIKAYTKLCDYREETHFFAWLAAITRNEALMHLRKHKREVSMQDDDIHFFEQAAESESLPDALMESKQIQSLIDTNIDKLPTNFRTVFVLRAVEQLTVKETAAILDIREDTVKTRFFRAKRLLREQIQRYLDSAGMTVYEFGGHHCNMIIYNVMRQIKKQGISS